MEDEFYHLTVKGNDLKTYVRRFQELATLCPTMVPDSEKMMEVFIGGLPRSIEGNCKYQVITNESLTTEELSTTTTTATIITTTTITPTLTTVTIITNHNKTKGKKLSELMLPLQLRTVGLQPLGPYDKLPLENLNLCRLILGDNTRAEAPYRLAPSELQVGTHANQLHELADRGNVE
ncbi:hypothetical protein Tco_1068525 [Tanacetum coccineum]|uniref:Reverse transcriptase domain-containing protein n=1 Tax=Tanacetum coccineum TaxID=301880 RepID=A0ABQ5HFZ6_9ASTR